MSKNITVIGITKQFMVDSWTHYDKFKEKAFYHLRRRDESLWIVAKDMGYDYGDGELMRIMYEMCLDVLVSYYKF
ncbi:hypothetical protein Hanom_Chr09g00773281 [Helianthus anomalus]